MEANHTPGPWKALAADAEHLYIRVRGTRLGSRFKVANVLPAGYDNAPQREADETKANAALIVAAPDLLEALDWLVQILPDPELDNDELQRCWTRKARAAIAKASS